MLFVSVIKGCCGNLWISRRCSRPVDPDPVTTTASTGEEIDQIPAGTETIGEMNLTAAVEDSPKLTLISWLEKEEEEREKVVSGLGENCCVCMERKKGAAFIPCGHAYCRVCARDLWIERRSCALCNQPILEILDLF